MSLAVPPFFIELMLCPLHYVYYVAAANSFQNDKTKAAIIALIVNKFAKTSKPKLHYDANPWTDPSFLSLTRDRSKASDYFKFQ